MSQQELNLGILAHVDAGKTTLTERLLFEAGVIDEIGSVDAGTTQTDSLALERKRGITIKSAVTSFSLGNVHVNLIDTPGHPDFIAEVERVLSVLDGAVLVISAVEGVQPQTRILMRALQRLRIPTLLFVNKIDRAGADEARVLQAISERLTTRVVPMGTAHALGTRTAEFRQSDAEDRRFRARLAEVLAERDDAIMAAYVEDELDLADRRLRDALAAQTRRAVVHPVFLGAAITGAGVGPLMTAIADLLPVATGDAHDPVSATVFKIERGPTGEKVAYVRMFSGTIHVRDRLHFGRGLEDKVTAIAVFERGPAVRRSSVSAGAVARLWGLAGIQIGDAIGESATNEAGHQFPPPTLESVRRSDAAGRRRTTSHRARSARRAGSVDRRAAGRRPRGDLRLALRRGAEGGDPGDARRRLRHRSRVPRDDADLRRATERYRRGRRSPPCRVESVQCDDRASCRAGRLPARASTSGSRSTTPEFRCTSTRDANSSSKRWTSTCVTRCRRASAAGR